MRSSLLFSAVAFACAAVATPTWGLDLAKGKKLYQDHCASCHGDTGRPVMVNTPDFTRGEGLQATDTEIMDNIELGRRQMPGFQGILSREELSDIVIYLRTLWF